jgi:phosphoglycerol transferase MdoB-like AlkP superfamily enzyme
MDEATKPKPEAMERDGKSPLNSPEHSRQSCFGLFGRGTVPWDVGGRIILLFAVLCLIKLVMLAGFRKHLFEIHWRINSTPQTWVNEAVFYAFAVLAGLNLWQLGKRCRAGGARVVRAANLCVLVLGVLFLFLTFHAGDKSYLSLLMSNTLGWWDLKWYLSLAFFFQPPFLAGWLGTYGLLYYGLARTGREHWMLHVTALFVASYTAFFLQDLMVCRDALLVADCLGVACLLAGSGFPRPLPWFWAVQPGLWIVFLFLVFGSQDMTLNSTFTLSLEWSGVMFAGASVFACRRKFYPAWSWFLPFALASFLLLTTLNYETATNYQYLLCLGLTLPRYFLGELVLTFLLLAAATLYRRLLPRGSLWWLDGISLLLIVLALADLRLSQIMGIRLDWQAIAFGADLKMVWRMAKPFLPGIAAGLIILIGLYAVLMGCWQRADASKTLPMKSGARFLLVSFLLLGIAGKWFAGQDKAEGESALLLAETSPWFERTVSPVMDGKTFVATAQNLGMQPMLAGPAAPSSRSPRDLNVVLIFQESSYNKYLSLFNGRENTQPLLSKYQDRMELFPNFFCNFAGSINARFATLAGLYPTRDYKTFTLHRVEVKSLFEILHENDYLGSVFYSSFIDYTGFRDFLQGRGIDAIYDADTMPGRRSELAVAWGQREDATLGAIQSQIRQYAAGHHKFFLSYFPAAPHYPYDGMPRAFQKFQMKTIGDYTPKYLNELLFMDQVITSILDELKNSGLLDKTLVIITDDHGEMLGENGGPIGHGWAVTPELANIPLIIMDPAHPGCHINETIGSQVDLLPTLLDLLDIPIPQGQLYQGVSLYSVAAQTNRTIYLNSFQQYGIIQDHLLICGNRETESQEAATNPPVKVYAIANRGSHTLFSEIRGAHTPPPSIFQFDQFQENFLLNYSHYRETIPAKVP